MSQLLLSLLLMPLHVTGRTLSKRLQKDDVIDVVADADSEAVDYRHRRPGVRGQRGHLPQVLEKKYFSGKHHVIFGQLTYFWKLEEVRTGTLYF